MLIRDWQPDLPAGTLRSVVLHWTAGDYDTIFPAYHYCLSGAVDVVVHATYDLRANMRDVSAGGAGYAAHTQGRNSFAAGIAICAMRDATPYDFAAFALTAAQIEALCAVAARVVKRYGIALRNVRTHAEAALDDGYFGADGDAQRWDIARLAPAAAALSPHEAPAVGEHLRTRIADRC